MLVLGFDKERFAYFNNSRSLLPSNLQQNAFYTHEETFKHNMQYKVPDNVASLKNFSIYKDSEHTEVKEVKSY